MVSCNRGLAPRSCWSPRLCPASSPGWWWDSGRTPSSPSSPLASWLACLTVSSQATRKYNCSNISFWNCVKVLLPLITILSTFPMLISPTSLRVKVDILVTWQRWPATVTGALWRWWRYGQLYPLSFLIFKRLFFLEFFQECWRDFLVPWNADSVPPPRLYQDSFLGLPSLPNTGILGNVFL